MTRRYGARRIILCGAVTLAFGLCLAAHISQWWELYIAYGIIVSVGLTSAGWLPSIILIRAWFLERVGMAVGIVSAGIGGGITVVVPLTQFLIERVGWRWTYRLFALAIVGWVVPATYALVRDPVRDEAPRAEPVIPRASARSWTLGQAVRDRRYWLLGGMYFLGNMVTQLLFVHQVAFLVDHGVVPLVAASVGGVAGLASIVGKIGWGSLSDRTGREISYTWALLCLAGSLGVLVLAGGSPGSGLPYVYAVLFGLGYAGTAVLIPAATSDLFAGPGFASIFGSLQAVLAVGAALGAWAAGQIFDVTGTYTLALWLAFAVSLASPALMWLAAPSRPRRALPYIER